MSLFTEFLIFHFECVIMFLKYLYVWFLVCVIDCFIIIYYLYYIDIIFCKLYVIWSEDHQVQF